MLLIYLPNKSAVININKMKNLVVNVVIIINSH